MQQQKQQNRPSCNKPKINQKATKEQNQEQLKQQQKHSNIININSGETLAFRSIIFTSTLATDSN